LERKAVSGIMLVLLTMGMLSLAFNIQPAKSEWTGTVYIRADGSIDPPDAPITSYDNVTYTLTGNITSYHVGIWVERSDIVLIGNGRFIKGTNAFAGISLQNINNVTVRGINIKGFTFGIYLRGSNCSIVNNNFTNCGLWVENSQNFVTNNTVNGMPLVYLENASNLSVNYAGQVILVGCENIKVEDLNLCKTTVGVELLNTNNCTIKGNIITENVYCGIKLSSSYNNNICENDVSKNSVGIWLDSSNNSVTRNTIINNLDVGIYVLSSDNIISQNDIANNGKGIDLRIGCSNFVCENNIINNTYGIWLEHSKNNTFHHNNFICNIYQVFVYWDYPVYAINFWDNGYLSGGNYWSDYTGNDVRSGPYQNVTCNDGIGDISYVIDENNVDRYPLMGPFNSFNTSVGYPVDVISNSTVEGFKYFESNSTIIMHVSNMTANQTIGFCRLTIPHDVMYPPYTVKVNGTTIEYQAIYENHTEGISIIYFAYEHSKLEITIIPEFPPIITLTLMLMMISIIASVKRKVLRRKILPT